MRISKIYNIQKTISKILNPGAFGLYSEANDL